MQKFYVSVETLDGRTVNSTYQSTEKQAEGILVDYLKNGVINFYTREKVKEGEREFEEVVLVLIPNHQIKMVRSLTVNVKSAPQPAPFYPKNKKNKEYEGTLVPKNAPTPDEIGVML